MDTQNIPWLLSLKSQVRSEYARRLELGVIVCAEFSYDKIRPRQCMAVEFEELKGVKVIAVGMVALHEV